MTCARCGKENEDGTENCVRCGIKLDAVAPAGGAAEPEAGGIPCYRHPRELTTLSCGRCGKPVCTRCAKLGAAGPRCPECARHNVTVRPAAIAHEAKTTARRWLGASPWLALVVALTLGSWLLGWVRDCACTPRAPNVEVLPR
jgi:hypothetical protein